MGGSTRRKLLLAVLVAQVAALLGITALHGVRLAEDTRVMLEVVPVDPLDLARGAYVDLRYDLEDLELPDGIHDGDDVYVELERPDANGDAWTAVATAPSPNDFDDPDAFVRFPVEGGVIDTTEISTYYASADEAERLETDLVNGGLAEVVLSEDGDPLLDVVRG